MRLAATVVLMLISSLAWGAPFVVSGIVDSRGTQCGVFLDAAAKQIIPVTAVTSPTIGNICKFDLAPVSSGSHTITMTLIGIDPVLGSLESPQSSPPLVFVKPTGLAAPSGLQIAP